MDVRWLDELDGCPDQCLAEVMGPHGIPYVLYLRWRHEDPWEAYFIRNSTIASMATIHDWSEEVFERNGDVFQRGQTALTDIKARVVRIWEMVMETGIIDAYFKEAQI